jgi:hypothetical protein
MMWRAISGRSSVWDAKLVAAAVADGTAVTAEGYSARELVAAAVLDGTAVTAEGYAARVEEVKSGGKCWSVDEQRSAMVGRCRLTYQTHVETTWN